MERLLRLHREFLPSRRELALLEARAGCGGRFRPRRSSERLIHSTYSPFLGRGLEFEEVRAYAPGDDLRAMEWRVTARTGKPHIKVYREERQQAVEVIMDASPGMLFGSGTTTKLAQAIRVTAWLIFSLMERGARAGTLICGDLGGMEIPPLLPRRAVWRLLDYFSTTGAGGAPRNWAWRRLLASVPPGRFVLVLSDFLGWPDEDWNTLKQVAARHPTLGVRLFDPRECSLPDVGPLRIASPDGGEPILIDTSSRRGREAYAACWQAHVREVQRRAAEARMLVVPVSTADDPAIHPPGLESLARR